MKSIDSIRKRLELRLNNLEERIIEEPQAPEAVFVPEEQAPDPHEQALVKHIEDLKRQLEEKQQRIKEFEQSTKSFLNNALKDEQSKISNLAEKAAHLLHKQHELEKVVSELQSENTYLNQDNEDLRSRMQQAVELGKALTEELHAKDDEIMLLTQKLTGLGQTPVFSSSDPAPGVPSSSPIMESMLGQLIGLLNTDPAAKNPKPPSDNKT